MLVNSPLLLSGQWLTLDEALASGALTIMQRGTRSKPGLWVENSSLDEHVFLMKDETIEQNSQTRMVRRDTVLAPGERVELNVLGLQVPPTAGGKHLSTDERLEQLCRKSCRGSPGHDGVHLSLRRPVARRRFLRQRRLGLEALAKASEIIHPGPTSLPNTADYRGNSRNDAEAIEFFGRICGAHSEVSGTTGSGVGLRTNDRNLRGGAWFSTGSSSTMEFARRPWARRIAGLGLQSSGLRRQCPVTDYHRLLPFCQLKGQSPRVAKHCKLALPSNSGPLKEEVTTRRRHRGALGCQRLQKAT